MVTSPLNIVFHKNLNELSISNLPSIHFLRHYQEIITREKLYFNVILDPLVFTYKLT